MNEFYSSVVPRIRDETVFGAAGKNAKIELDCERHRPGADLQEIDRDVNIVLYHSIKVWTKEGVETTIQRLVREKILISGQEYRFYSNFLMCRFLPFEYFCTTRRHYESVLSDLRGLV